MQDLRRAGRRVCGTSRPVLQVQVTNGAWPGWKEVGAGGGSAGPWSVSRSCWMLELRSVALLRDLAPVAAAAVADDASGDRDIVGHFALLVVQDDLGHDLGAIEVRDPPERRGGVQVRALVLERAAVVRRHEQVDRVAPADLAGIPLEHQGLVAEEQAALA